MKKILLLATFVAVTLSLSAQTIPTTVQQGDMALLGQIGYQTNYERFGISAQYRYNLMRNIRIAPDVTFFFPKDKVTGLDINLNAHYVFYFPQDRFSVYPLAGFGMQNNFHGKHDVRDANGNVVTVDSKSKTSFAFNLGGGITYALDARSFVNAEAKFMFADEDAAVIMIGYGYRF